MLSVFIAACVSLFLGPYNELTYQDGRERERSEIILILSI